MLSANLTSLKPTALKAKRCISAKAADRTLWYKNAVVPEYLDGSMAGDFGFDPLCLGEDPQQLKWFQQAELVHARWAMLGVTGIVGQELFNPSVNWYSAGMPENIPEPFNALGISGILGAEIWMMHWAEVRRWQDIKEFGSVDEDPIFKGNKIKNVALGYPGFDPLNLSGGKGFEGSKNAELVNGRLAMISFVGYTVQAQATGKGPIDCLFTHLSNQMENNLAKNIGTCAFPDHVNVEGASIGLVNLWPCTPM